MYFCSLLLGFSGIVMAKRPCSKSGTRYFLTDFFSLYPKNSAISFIPLGSRQYSIIRSSTDVFAVLTGVVTGVFFALTGVVTGVFSPLTGASTDAFSPLTGTSDGTFTYELIYFWISMTQLISLFSNRSRKTEMLVLQEISSGKLILLTRSFINEYDL